MDRAQAIIRAANHRTDVRCFSIVPASRHWFCRFYGERPIESGEIDLRQFAGNTRIRDILDDLIGPEPPTRGEREGRWHDDHDMLMNRLISSTHWPPPKEPHK